MKIFGFEIGRSKKSMTADQLHEVLMSFLGGGGESEAGISVTPTKAMQIGTVYACVRIIAESMAQLPRGLYTKDANDQTTIRDDLELHNVLKWHPNPFQDGYQFFEMATGHVALRGNHYSFINWSGKGEVTELLPFHPDVVEVKQNRDWSLTYKVNFSDGKTESIPAGNIFHLRGLSDNGYLGLNPITAHKNGLGLSLATEKHGSKLFKNGARPGGVLRHPKRLDDDSVKRILGGWRKAHGGDNSGGTAVLEDGMDYQTVAISNEDAQYLQTRQFQLLEIARMFRVPAALLDLHEKAATYASAEQFFLSFVKFTMLPWVIRWEQAIRNQLLSDKHKQEGVYPKFNVSGMERADMKSRFEAYSKGIDKGIYCPNDCRKLEDLPPREGGDEYLKPLNMEVSGQGDAKKTGFRTILHKSGSSLDARNKLADQYRPRLKEAAEKVVSGEVKAIQSALDSDRSGFLAWLDTYEKNLPATVQEKFAVVLSQYANELKNAALEDVDAEGVEDFVDFVESYLKTYANRWTQSSIGQLKALITEFEGAEADEAIKTRLGEWQSKRSQKAANDEAVRASNAVTRYVWAAAGVTHLIWKTQGSKTCPFCHQLDGKKVGIMEPFIGRNETITASNGSGMKIYGKKLHAPIHQGCKCTIIPG